MSIKSGQGESKIKSVGRGNRMKGACSATPRRQREKALGARCKTLRCTTVKEREDKPQKKSTPNDTNKSHDNDAVNYLFVHCVFSCVLYCIIFLERG